VRTCRLWSGLWIVVAVVICLTTLASSGMAATASISASPNPCNVTTVGGTCTLTLSWSTSATSSAQVWVKDGTSAPEQYLFTGTSGSQSLNWIQALPQNYNFRIYAYAGTTRGALLNSVQVSVPAPVPAGSISVSPNPCNINTLGGTCTVTLSWSAQGVSAARVYVTDALGSEVQIATTTSGSQSLNWIQALPQRYTFRLYNYSTGSRGAQLAVVDVAVPAPAPSGSISVSPNPCTVATHGGTCTVTLAWNSQNVTAARIFVTDATGAEQQLAATTSGSQSLNWIQALPQRYTFRMYNYSTGSRGNTLASVEVAVPAPPTPTGSLSISPNPCEVKTFGGTCTATLAWSTQNASAARVFVTDALGAEQQLATTTSGSQSLNWIQALPQKYTFRLYDYSTGSRGALLATVVVSVPAPIPSGTLSANPNPCTVSTFGGTCTTTLSWNAQNVGAARVYVTDAKGAEQQIATTTSGSQSLNWIQALPQKYTFKLFDYTAGSRGSTLATLEVAVPSPVPSGTMSITPNPCSILTFGGTCTVALTWSTQFSSAARIYVTDALGAEQQIATTTSGTQSLNWIQALPQRYSFKLYDYSTGARGNVLSTVEVAVPSPVAPSGTLSVTPNPCAVTTAGGTCTVTLAWTTQSVSAARVFVTDALGSEQQLFNATTGSQSLNWIQALPQRYRFTLWDYSTGTRGTQLDSKALEVPAPVGVPSGTLTLSPNPCSVTVYQGTCNATLAWSAKNVTAAYVRVVPKAGTTQKIGSGTTGSMSLPWLEALPQSYSFHLYNDSGNGKSELLASVDVAIPAPAASPDFTLEITPKSKSITQGDEVNVKVIVTASATYSGTVVPSADQLPPGYAGVKWVPQVLKLTPSSSQTANLTIWTDKNTSIGSRLVTIRASDVLNAKSKDLTVNIAAAQTASIVVSPTLLEFSYLSDVPGQTSTRQVDIRSSSGTLPVTATVTKGQDWLKIEQTGVSTDASLAVSVSPSLAPSDRLGEIIVSSPGVPSKTVSVTLNVGPRPAVAFISAGECAARLNPFPLPEPLNPALPTIILTHGLQSWSANASTLWTVDHGDSSDGTWKRPGAYYLIRDYLANAGIKANIYPVSWSGAFQPGFVKGVPTKSAYNAGRSHAQTAGQCLARRLIQQLGKDYSQPIHFIGHSLGTIVNAHAASDLLQSLPVDRAQFTALDRPDLVNDKIKSGGPGESCIGYNSEFFRIQLEKALKARPGLTVYLDNYYAQPSDTSWSGVGGPASAGDRLIVHNGDLIKPGRVGNKTFSQGVTGDDHSGVNQWYRWTVHPVDSPFPSGGESVCSGGKYTGDLDQSLSPCNTGWRYSLALGTQKLFWPGTKFDILKTTTSNLALGSVKSSSCSQASGAALSLGNCSTSIASKSPERSATIDSSTDPFISLDVTVPANSGFLAFLFQVRNINAGDTIVAMLDQTPVWHMASSAVDESQWLGSGAIPVESFSGSRRLTFALFSGGSSLQLDVKDITFTSVDTATAVTPATASIPAAGGSGSLTVTANPTVNWSASSNASWLTINPAAGTGNGSVGYTAAANNSGVARSASITVGSATATITQSPTVNCAFVLSSPSSSVGNTAGTGNLTITASATGCAWSAVSNSAFITITSTASGTGPGSITFAFTANTGAARSGIIMVGGQTFTVTQSAAGCAFSITPSTITTGYAGGVFNSVLSVAGASCPWLVQQPPSMTANPGEGGSGAFQQSYTVYPNFSSRARTMTVSVGSAALTVNQSGNPLTSNERFVQLVYFAFLGRLPEPTELAAQAATLNAGGARADMVNSFFGTQEFNAKGRFIAGLYVGLLNRDAEFNGWIYQRGALQSGIVTSPGLVTNFINSPEFQLQNGALTNENYVRMLYRQVLLREPAPAEVGFQSGVLNSGANTRTNMAYGFLASPEFQIGTGPRLISFLLYACLLQRDSTAAERSALITQMQTGTTVRTAALSILNSSEFATALQ